MGAEPGPITRALKIGALPDLRVMGPGYLLHKFRDDRLQTQSQTIRLHLNQSSEARFARVWCEFVGWIERS